MGSHFGGDMQPVSQIVDDGAGHVSFLININGEAGGSTHDGTVRCDGPVTIVSEQHMDGAGLLFSQTNGDIYQWEARCGDLAGLHYVIELAYSQGATNCCGRCGAPVGTSAGASLPDAASDSAVTASGGAGASATTDD
jgi:hypothetical protein